VNLGEVREPLTELISSGESYTLMIVLGARFRAPYEIRSQLYMPGFSAGYLVVRDALRMVSR